MGLFLKLFNKREKRAVTEPVPLCRANAQILECAVRYAKELQLPFAQESVFPMAVQVPEGKRTQYGDYFLLICTAGDENGTINAGYIAGQTAIYLTFLGYPARVVREMPEWVCHLESLDCTCVAAVVFGVSDELHPEKQMMAGRQCICKDRREHWAEDVLKFTKYYYPVPDDAVQVTQEENGIRFSPKNTAFRKKAESELVTGMTLAYVMAAAEELWVDLEMSEGTGPKRAIYLKRKQEMPVWCS